MNTTFYFYIGVKHWLPNISESISKSKHIFGHASVSKDKHMFISYQVHMDLENCQRVYNGTGWVNQAYSRFSTTHGHITDSNLESVVYAGVCVVSFNVDLSCLRWTIYARQLLGAKPPIQLARGEQKGITLTIYTDPEPPSRLPNSLMPSGKLRSANLPLCYAGAV